MMSIQKLPDLSAKETTVIQENVNEVHYDSSDEEYDLD
jgi:hypothetical protein